MSKKILTETFVFAAIAAWVTFIFWLCGFDGTRDAIVGALAYYVARVTWFILPA